MVNKKLVDIVGLSRYHENLKGVLNTKQDNIDDLSDIRSGAALGATALQEVPAEYVTEEELAAKTYATVAQVEAKQDIISDLETIREGAAAGAVAEQNAKDFATALVMDGDEVRFDAAGSASQALTDAKGYADGLNTAMDDRVKVLEAIDHEQLASDASAAAVATVLDGAPEKFDTLKEIAQWISDSESAATAADLVNRVKELEDIDHDAYIAADEALQANIDTKIGKKDIMLENGPVMGRYTLEVNKDTLKTNTFNCSEGLVWRVDLDDFYNNSTTYLYAASNPDNPVLTIPSSDQYDQHVYEQKADGKIYAYAWHHMDYTGTSFEIGVYEPLPYDQYYFGFDSYEFGEYEDSDSDSDGGGMPIYVTTKIAGFNTKDSLEHLNNIKADKSEVESNIRDLQYVNSNLQSDIYNKIGKEDVMLTYFGTQTYYKENGEGIGLNSYEEWVLAFGKSKSGIAAEPSPVVNVVIRDYDYAGGYYNIVYTCGDIYNASWEVKSNGNNTLDIYKDGSFVTQISVGSRLLSDITVESGYLSESVQINFTGYIQANTKTSLEYLNTNKASKSELESNVNTLQAADATLQSNIEAKQDIITDLQTIREGAALGATALQEVPAEYVTEEELAAKTYATETYVNEKVAALVDGAPETLDTLDELAAALKDNADIVDVLTQSIGLKQDTITDLETIRSGAALGATALQEVPAEYVTEDELTGKGYLTADDFTFAQDSEIDALFN